VAISPDGKLIACNYQEQPNSPLKMAVFSIEGGPPVKIFYTPGGLSRRIRWAVDGRALTYSYEQRGVANIWSQPISGGPPKQLTNFTDGQISTFAWSPDGKELSVTRGATTSDVVLISNFR
jgi:Tol biopolymer transport system component